MSTGGAVLLERKWHAATSWRCRSLPASAIGAIQIADNSALVEVDDAEADDITRALGSAKIRGRRLEVRRDRPR